MNNDAFDQILRDWLGEGPERGRVEALDRALAATHRTAQRPGWRQRPDWIVSVRGDAFPSRAGAFGWSSVARLAAIAVVGLLAVGAVMYLVRPAATVGNPSPPPISLVQQVWTTNQAVAMTIQRQDPTDKGRYYWRAVTYDQISLNGWTQTNSTTIVRQPNTQLFAGLADAVDPAGLHSFTFTVTPGDFNGPTILSPGTPVEVKETTRLTYVGHTGYFATLERDGGSGSYTVTALTQPPAGAPGQLTQAELRVAGTAYPQEVKDLYLQVALGSIGPNARKLEAKVVAEAASSAPFDLASQIVTELHSPTYTYATDVRDLDCATLSTAECFATYKRGFCQYYAATMAVLLRDLGVPTRIVEGFLPGTVDRNSGTETILLSSALTWVEVYFPGHGWVMFDPTGTNLSQVEPLPSK
jgi:transglutaminase-like putative cysteine protease